MYLPNKWDLPDLGFGLGLRTDHYHYIRETWPDVGWFEIISENFIDNGGLARANLDTFAERYPIVMHGISLSIGSADPLDFELLAKLKELARYLDTPWVSDHVCWTGVHGKNGHDLYPIPYNEPMLAHMVERVRTVQDVLERPLVLENPSSYVTFASSTMSEHRFMRRLADEADCALLLDVNNIYVTCRNHGMDMLEYLDEIPLERVVQLHVAGHSDFGTHCIDTHDHHVIDPVWDLLTEVYRRGGSRPTMIEWDDHIPDFEVVLAELNKARAYQALAHQTLDPKGTEPGSEGEVPVARG
jgi:uncharacterized protein (UPF0276 family)